MKLIATLLKDFLNCLKPTHDIKTQEKSYNIIGLIIVFFGLYFGVALAGIVSIRLVLKTLNLYGVIGVYNEVAWMFYGVILGISFAFFVQSFPSFGKDCSPEILYKSFKHHFKYFFYLIFVIFLYCGLILIVLRFVHIK